MPGKGFKNEDAFIVEITGIEKAVTRIQKIAFSAHSKLLKAWYFTFSRAIDQCAKRVSKKRNLTLTKEPAQGIEGVEIFND